MVTAWVRSLAAAAPDGLADPRGRVLVVSDAKLMAQFVTENNLGAVFPTGDAGALGAAVLTVIDQAKDREEGLAERYSWQAQEPKLFALYQRVAPLPADLAVVLDDVPAEFPDLEVTVCES